MIPASLLMELIEKGIILWSVDGELRFRASKGVLTPELREQLVRHKAEIVAQLNGQKYVLPSYAQQRLWFLDQLEPGSGLYNVPAALQLTGRLDVVALERSLNEIVRRHEVLRTHFGVVEGQAVQIITPQLHLHLPVVDLSVLPEAMRQAQARVLAQEEAGRPFDLGQGPLLRVLVVRLEAEAQVLLLTLHHIIADGWSMEVLTRELVTLYRAFAKGVTAALPDLPLQYADFAVWQRHWLTGEVLEKQLGYWKRQLSGHLPVLELPTDHPRPPVQTFRGTTISFQLSVRQTDELRSLSQQAGTTLFMTLLAAFKILLYRYTGQEDILVGTPIANRNQANLEGLIGFFVNTLVLRTDLTGNPTLRELLGRVRNATLEAYEHQDLPFERLVEELHLARDLSRSPLFQVMFVLQNTPQSAVDLPGLALRALDATSDMAKFDLTLTLSESEQGLVGEFEYNTDLFEAATIARLAGHYVRVLESVAGDPGQRLSAVGLLSEAERHQLLVAWNATQRAYPQQQCIHTLVEAQVAQTPEAVAVVCEEHHLTYAVLNRRANQVAHHLQRLGVGPEVLVAICVERSAEMIIGLLGILKAGGAYVPLDPAYPPERLAFILNDSLASIVLTQSNLLERLPAHHARPVCLDSEGAAIALEQAGDSTSPVTPQNLAYVIYTSGSTGRPKGVAIQHLNTVAFIHWSHQVFEPVMWGGVLAATSISFDLSVFEIFATLGAGGTIVLAQDALQLPNLMTASRVRLVNSVPSAARELLHSGGLPDAVRVINLAGEPLSQTIVEQLYQAGTLERVYDLYGPSETTTYSTYTLRQAGGRATIGRPIANTQVYVLDAHWNPVPVGATGEVYIGGAGVTRGYLNRPDLTAERFIPNPFAQDEAEAGTSAHGPRLSASRLYKTGDLARFLSDGNLEYAGRIDHQVKVRGYRIELGEVEAVLRQQPQVQDVIVVVRTRAADEVDRQLVAYVVVRDGETVDDATLRRGIREKLPEYMMPAVFVMLAALPLTPNGKVDRKALPEPTRAKTTDSLIVPRDLLELQLVRIWESILDVRPIGVTQNFFELGGHSLLAMRLMAYIERELGQRLPIATLFQGATIEQLAGALRRREHVAVSSSALVPIQIGATQKQPVFLVHPAGGNVVCYRALAQQMGLDRPFYGFQAQGLDGEQLPRRQVEDMAHHYVDLLRTVQPEGPYLLGGWSMGGVVAFEMSQQLLAQDQLVGRLMLIDTHAPSSQTQPELDELTLLSSFILELGLPVLMIAPELNRLRPLPAEEQLAYVVQQAKRAGILPSDVELLQVQRLYQVFRCNLQAVQHYVPRVYAEPLTLFKASERLNGPPLPEDLGWRAWAKGDFQVHRVPGNHYTLLRQPHVETLAERVRDQLSAVELGTATVKAT